LPTNERKKEIEAYMLAAAQRAGVPIPAGGKPGLEPAPDFIFEDNRLGIELTELTRSADEKGGFVPAAEDAFHREVVQKAREQYYSAPDAKRARLVVYFSTRVKKKDKRQMANALCEFVRANIHRSNPVAGFYSRDTPDGIGSMSIASECGDWWSGECGGPKLTQILSCRKTCYCIRRKPLQQNLCLIAVAENLALVVDSLRAGPHSQCR
jgi:hypothetical protein